jgi:dihydrofolate reductase
MRKLVQFMHVSLDGFVSSPKGEMDFVHVDDEIFGFAGRQTNRSDTALYGRVTYEMMNAYWPTAADKPNATEHDIQHSEWYTKVQKVVLSRTMKEPPSSNTTILHDNIGPEIKKLKSLPGQEIIIFGSPGAGHSLLAEGLIDEIWLFVNPVLLGDGIPMFKGIKERKMMTLIKSQAMQSGVVCLHYQVL